MAEQGLKAVIYPELDEAYMGEFMKKFSQQMSDATITVGASITDSDSGSSSGGQNGTAPFSTNDRSAINKKDVKEAVTESTKESNEDTDGNEKKHQSITKGLGSILGSLGGVASAVGVGAVGVAGATVGIFKFLESTSEPLRSVMNLFKTAFDMIWMPVGTILAVQLMPVLRTVMMKIADWMSRAWEIYDTQGWVGLIRGALETSFDVLMILFQDMFPILGEVLGTLLWELFKLTPLGLVLQHFFGEDFWDDFPEVMRNVGGAIDEVSKWVDGIADWLEENGVMGFFRDVRRFLEDIWNKLTLKSFSQANEQIGEKFESGDVLGGIAEVGKNYTPIGIIGKVAGWWAEGGVATRPTIAGVGEAGPEAIIPLNQFSNILNEYSNSVGGGTNNSITININGGNAMEIGEEVQRVLEKTVGKASSKMMWW